MKELPIILFLILLLCGCNRHEKREAQKLLNRIEESFEEKKYNLLKLQVDSLNLNYRPNVALRKKANLFLYKVELFEAERTFAYLSNQIPLKQLELDSVLSRFTYDKSEPYKPEGEYIHKSIAREYNAMQPYLKAQIKQNGEIFLVSVYSGYKDCTYQSVKVSNNDFYVFSPTVLPDQAQNYAFKTSYHHWRLLLFSEDESMDMIQFIATQCDTRIMVTLTGPGCSREYVLKDKYKKAIRDTYDVSLMMKELNQIRKARNNSEKQIEVLKNKISG